VKKLRKFKLFHLAIKQNLRDISPIADFTNKAKTHILPTKPY